jgi:hypothetical protein
MMEGSDADDVSTAPSFETTSANREFRINMGSYVKVFVAS